MEPVVIEEEKEEKEDDDSLEDFKVIGAINEMIPAATSVLNFEESEEDDDGDIHGFTSDKYKNLILK